MSRRLIREKAMQGQRKHPNEHGHHMGQLTGNLGAHDVTEHEDGTITVSPSILISDGNNEWYGYLERGVWREC